MISDASLSTAGLGNEDSASGMQERVPLRIDVLPYRLGSITAAREGPQGHAGRSAVLLSLASFARLFDVRAMATRRHVEGHVECWRIGSVMAR